MKPYFSPAMRTLRFAPESLLASSGAGSNDRLPDLGDPDVTNGSGAAGKTFEESPFR